MTEDVRPFVVKDCTLVAIATGDRAQNLKELRERLLTIHPGSIYYHFWGGHLRPKFVDPEYNNDFAAWVKHALHDTALAERLAIVDPTWFPNIEDLRKEVLEIIEERLDETEWIPWAKREEQFHFIRAQMIIFSTRCLIKRPEDLLRMIPHLSEGSIFYHFIDARRRTEGGVNDFCAWLHLFGERYQDLCARLCAIDPYFVTLAELREELLSVLKGYFQ